MQREGGGGVGRERERERESKRVYVMCLSRCVDVHVCLHTDNGVCMKLGYRGVFQCRTSTLLTCSQIHVHVHMHVCTFACMCTFQTVDNKSVYIALCIAR